jgi:MFS family permease
VREERNQHDLDRIARHAKRNDHSHRERGRLQDFSRKSPRSALRPASSGQRRANTAPAISIPVTPIANSAAFPTLLGYLIAAALIDRIGRKSIHVLGVAMMAATFTAITSRAMGCGRAPEAQEFKLGHYPVSGTIGINRSILADSAGMIG